MWRREAVRALFEVVFGEDRVVGHLVCVALEGVEGERFILSNYRTPTRHRKPVVIWSAVSISPNQGFQSVSIPIGVTYARRKTLMECGMPQVKSENNLCSYVQEGPIVFLEYSTFGVASMASPGSF